MTSENSNLPVVLTDQDKTVVSAQTQVAINDAVTTDPSNNVNENLTDETHNSPGSKKSITTSSRRKSSTSSVTCKICFDAYKDEEPITPCLCKGSIGKVHLSCLERWLGMTNAHTCELCGYRFSTVRRPMYKVCYSVYFWLFKEQNRRGIGMDTAIFLILTPIICSGIYSCIAISSLNENIDLAQNKSAVGNWTSIALTLMAAIMAFGYYLWASLVIRSHAKAWYMWWQARNVVHVLNAVPPDPEHPPRPPLLPSRPIIIETAFV